MKEIDLLPQWYKSNRKQRSAICAQYAALGLVLFVMTLWTLFTSGSVKKAQAELISLEAKRVSTEQTVREFTELSSMVEQLKQNKVLVDKADSHIDVSSTLAELSFLLDGSVLISRLSFAAERFSKITNKAQIRDTAQFSQAGRETMSGPVRFAVRMTGVAVDSGKVADLICRLEDSPYFCQVVPLYSENKQPKGKNIFTGDQTQITEFEIGCLIANYEDK